MPNGNSPHHETLRSERSETLKADITFVKSLLTNADGVYEYEVLKQVEKVGNAVLFDSGNIFEDQLKFVLSKMDDPNFGQAFFENWTFYCILSKKFDSGRLALILNEMYEDERKLQVRKTEAAKTRLEIDRKTFERWYQDQLSIRGISNSIEIPSLKDYVRNGIVSQEQLDIIKQRTKDQYPGVDLSDINLPTKENE